MTARPNCELCGEPCRMRRAGRQFCSFACEKEAARREYLGITPAACIVCGVDTWHKSGLSYAVCSDACSRARNEATRQRVLSATRVWQKSAAGRVAGARSRAKRRTANYEHNPGGWVRSACPEHLCYWCGVETFVDVDKQHPQRRELEHVMPICLGGATDPANEVWACRECNRGEGGKHKQHPLVWIAGMF
jgi:hypothetical protein